MEGYSSDQEQVESIKRWWQANGKAIVLGVVIGGSAIIGWRYWTNHQTTQAELAAVEYEQVMTDMRGGNKAAALERGGRLLEERRKTAYAALTALILAKLKVEDNDLQGARYYLQWAVENTKTPAVKDVARVRLARVLLASGDGNAALDALKGVDMEVYALSGQELKGDILVALKRIDEAGSAYRSALAAASAPGDGDDQARLQMKLSALGGAKAS